MAGILLIILLCIYFGIVFPLYLNAKSTRRKIIMSMMMAIILSVIAYYFIPEHDYDLVRHHEMASKFVDVYTVDDFFRVIYSTDLEIIPQLFGFLIAKIGDYNLMQSFIVFIGYSVLFYMLVDYRKNVNISNFKFSMLLLLIIFGQHILFYFSGLYNYFAINLFAFAIYLDYVKHRKIAPVFIAIISLLLHNSMILPFSLMLLLKIVKGRISGGFMMVFMTILTLWSILVLSVDASSIDYGILTNYVRAYRMYVTHNDGMVILYDGFYLFMSITKIIVSLYACWIQRNNTNTSKICNYVYLLTCSVIVLSFSSIAFTRFSSLILFVSLPMIMDTLGRKSDNSNMIGTVLVCFLGTLYFAYSLYVMSPLIMIGY